MTNPKAEARTQIAALLADVGAPVHEYPATASGRCVALVGAVMQPRGHVEVTVRCQVDAASGLAVLEQLEWDTLQAIRAGATVGWSETVSQSQDNDAGIIYTEYTTTTRP
jgi:hypothetical protein